jgi:hypothetical protein
MRQELKNKLAYCYDIKDLYPGIKKKDREEILEGTLKWPLSIMFL